MAPIKTSLGRSVGKLIESWRGRDAIGGLKLNSTIVTNRDNNAVLYDVTGGTEITSGDYKYHVFYQTGSLTIASSPTGKLSLSNPDNFGRFDYLVVAGGGGGGATRAPGNGGRGGGGGGGVRSNDPNYPFATPDTALLVPGLATPYTYTVTVGEGGAAANLPTGYPPPAGASGGNSSIIGPDHPGSGGAGGLVATGGGGGTVLPGQASGEGGSGGGGAYGTLVDGTSVSSPDGLSPTSQGFDGGGGQGAGGGGGGSGAESSLPNSSTGGSGAAFPEYPGPVMAPGIPTGPTWSPYVGTDGYYAGGGGGGGGYSSSVGGDGGNGGGGVGSDHPTTPNAPADPGVNYTGGGGGGGSGPGPENFNAGDGGHGVVIVRYKYQ
tara:strand:+ start:112 stop:1245 length:1134 start_codon:yes stop_codon:yes gene_type:complete